MEILLFCDKRTVSVLGIGLCLLFSCVEFMI